MDAIPGRLNQLEFEVNKQGMFRGQCNEFCGVGQGFMPIVIYCCDIKDYFHFLESKALFLTLQPNLITSTSLSLDNSNTANFYSCFVNW